MPNGLYGGWIWWNPVFLGLAEPVFAVFPDQNGQKYKLWGWNKWVSSKLCSKLFSMVLSFMNITTIQSPTLVHVICPSIIPIIMYRFKALLGPKAKAFTGISILLSIQKLNMFLQYVNFHGWLFYCELSPPRPWGVLSIAKSPDPKTLKFFCQ